jgi:glutathione S-transferase
MQGFEAGLDAVNKELSVTQGPWFLSQLSIVDLQYVSHIERMLASVAFWSGKKIRGDGKWPAIERWLDAFEERPCYMATKSDYYTHCMDIPPQYGPGVPLPGSESFASRIDGSDGQSWSLPLPPFQPSDLEPVSPRIDPGPEAACHEAARKLIENRDNVIKFACRGAGKKGGLFNTTIYIYTPLTHTTCTAHTK